MRRTGFPHTAADRLFAEQVAVGPGAGQRQRHHVILHVVDERPIREDAAFPMPHTIAGKFVVFVLLWKFFAP